MPFKKIIEPLQEALNRLGFEGPLPFQQKILSKIKGGTHVFGIAPEGSGKTTALIISVIQKLKAKAFGDAPRALIFVKDKFAALELNRAFRAFTKQTDLRVYCAYEELNIDVQRDEIYNGFDIVIATPKRLNKIFFLNGINLNKLEMLIVEDAEFLFRNNCFGHVMRIPESLNKCQYVIFSTQYDSRYEKYIELFMYNAQKIELSV